MSSVTVYVQCSNIAYAYTDITDNNSPGHYFVQLWVLDTPKWTPNRSLYYFRHQSHIPYCTIIRFWHCMHDQSVKWRRKKHLKCSKYSFEAHLQSNFTPETQNWKTFQFENMFFRFANYYYYSILSWHIQRKLSLIFISDSADFVLKSKLPLAWTR